MFSPTISDQHKFFFKQTLLKIFPDKQTWLDGLNVVCQALRYEELRKKYVVQSERPQEAYRNISLDPKL